MSKYVVQMPNTKGHPSDVKIRLYPEEEERVGRELKEALDTNFFKHWPVKTDAGPETGNRSKPEESKEFTAPLSDEAQARKLELMKQWKSKEEKDNKKRRSTKKRAEYEDDEMMDMLITTSLFKPTLEPYIGTGKKIPTREAVLDEYEQASVYEDAFEVQPLVSMDNDTMKSQGKWDNSKVAAQVSKNEESKTERKKYQRSMLPRRPRPSANTNDLQMPKVTDRKFSIPRRIHQAKSTNRKSDEEGPAFAPRK